MNKAAISVNVLASVFVCAGLHAAPEWEDHTKLSYGKEKPRTAFASFATVEEAAEAAAKAAVDYKQSGKGTAALDISNYIYIFSCHISCCFTSNVI